MVNCFVRSMIQFVIAYLLNCKAHVICLCKVSDASIYIDSVDFYAGSISAISYRIWLTVLEDSTLLRATVAKCDSYDFKRLQSKDNGKYMFVLEPENGNGDIIECSLRLRSVIIRKIPTLTFFLDWST